jgi:hypothetical protein
MGEVAVKMRQLKEVREWLDRHREKARPKIELALELEREIFGTSSWPSKVRAASRAGREHR